MKKYLILCFSFITIVSYTQNNSEGLVHWLNFKEAQEKNKVAQRPFLIDFYTNWCGWCKVMMQTTYSNPNIANYINNYFYPIKFNAETKDTIEFNGKKYFSIDITNPKSPHQIAIEFLGNSLAYPSTVFMTSDYQTKFLSQGYLKEQDIEPFLVFMVENVFRSANFNDFQTLFKNAFYNPELKRNTKTVSIKDLEPVNKKKPKKTIVFFYTNFCNSCKVTTQAVIHDSLVSKELNNNFNVVLLDAEMPDTILFKGKKYHKEIINGYPFNSIVNVLTNNKFSLPAVAFLDENLNPIETIWLFQPTQSLFHLMDYFGKDIYKTKTWDTYVKENSTTTPTNQASPQKSPSPPINKPKNKSSKK